MRFLQGHAQQLGPMALAWPIGDVILTNFDFGIIECAAEGVTGNAVVRVVHVVRLVISHPQPRFTRERVEQPPGEAFVSSCVKDTDIPRPHDFPEDGRETVQGDEDYRRSRTAARLDFRCQTGVIRRVNLVDAKLSREPCQARIAGYRSGICDGKDRLGRRRRAIAVNDQTRIGLREENRVEPFGHRGAQFGHAGIERDMARQVFLFEPESSQPGGDGASGMVPGQNEGRAAPRVQAYNGFRVIRPQQGRRVCRRRQNRPQTCRF